MANTPNFDTEKLRNEALQLRDAVAVHAGRVAVKATELAEQGIDWAAPRAQAALNEAIDRATPVVEDVTARAVDAADRARPAFEKARRGRRRLHSAHPASRPRRWRSARRRGNAVA